MHRIAAIQINSSADCATNLREAARLIAQAAHEGAELVILPENFALMGVPLAAFVEIRENFGSGPLQEFLSTQAAHHGIWLVGGTLPLATSTPQKVRSACLVFNPQGQCVARYDKIHLFDVTVSTHERHCESATFEGGQHITVVDTSVGRLGLAICYDLRFPELFRCLQDQGVELIGVPAAFTAVTGAAHWDVLVRARAIENLCYVIAANQVGQHADGRKTYGNSKVVDPWGTVLNQLLAGNGVVCANFNHQEQLELRERFPVRAHRKIVCQRP